MATIKLIISYDGTHFCGWQVQGKGERTVQGVLQDALSKILQTPIKVIGSGRTDSGVHALGQVAHFQAETSIPFDGLFKALNGELPADVVVLSLEEVSPDFHAQYSSKHKTYRYQVLNTVLNNPLLRQYVWHVPHQLDIDLMVQESKSLLGEHDFSSFVASDPSKKDQNNVRNVQHLTILAQHDGMLTFEITANGFLYKMVRNIVGTLVEIGAGKRAPGSLGGILEAKNRNEAGDTAPPQGLFLASVNY